MNGIMVPASSVPEPTRKDGRLHKTREDDERDINEEARRQVRNHEYTHSFHSIEEMDGYFDFL